MSAEAEPGENDEILEYYGLKVLVDRNDAPVLNGTTIDFKQSLMGGGFQINNLMLLPHVVVEVHLKQLKSLEIQSNVNFILPSEIKLNFSQTIPIVA